MNKNRKFVFFTILLLIIMLLIPTLYKVQKEHKEKKISVVEKRLIEAGLLCYYDGLCDQEKIYLKELYQQGYLEKQFDPISKIYYSEDSYLEKKDDTFIFVSKF